MAPQLRTAGCLLTVASATGSALHKLKAGDWNTHGFGFINPHFGSGWVHKAAGEKPAPSLQLVLLLYCLDLLTKHSLYLLVAGVKSSV